MKVIKIVPWDDNTEMVFFDDHSTGHVTQKGLYQIGFHPDIKALRYNDGKPQWSLVHFPSLEPMVRVLEYGAKKYEPDNWKKPMDKKQILDSAMRHLVQLMEDEELDSESNLQHVGHIMANMMFYSYHSKNK